MLLIVFGRIILTAFYEKGILTDDLRFFYFVQFLRGKTRIEIIAIRLF